MTSEDLWAPGWWELNRPEPRGPLPDLLQPVNWDTEQRDACTQVERLALSAFAHDEQRSAESHPYAVCPPGDTSSYVYMFTHYRGVHVRATLSPMNGRMTRPKLNLLSDLGFDWPYDGDDDTADCTVVLNTRDPEPGWRLGAHVAASAVCAVYREYFNSWVPTPLGRWSLVNLEWW